MLRKVILAGIMTIAVIVIIIALNRQGREPIPVLDEPDEPEISTGDPSQGGEQFEVKRLNEKREVVLLVQGDRAARVGDGPVEVTKPVITITSDPKRTIVITADMATLAGADREHLEDVHLSGNVQVKLTPLEGDPTVLTCAELEFFERDQQIRIPGDVLVGNPAFQLAGRNVEGSGTLGRLVLKENVRVTVLGGVGPLWNRIEGDPDESEPKTTSQAQTVPLVVTCTGSLVFEDDKNLATFHDDVRAMQGESSATADKMVVIFERGKSREEDGKKVEADPAETKIRKITLRGNDVDRVHLLGPGREGWGEELVFDTEAGLARLAGRRARLIQKRGQDSTRLEGTEMVFGKGVQLPEGLKVPELMRVASNKVMVLGDPARMEHKGAGAKTAEVLTGQVILMDRKAGAVLVGAVDRDVHIQQGGLELFGKSVTLYEKTVDRAEGLGVEGPGRAVVVADKSDEPGDASAPKTMVTFSEAMNYAADTRKAVFTGQVALVQGTSRLRCGSLEMTVGSDPDRPSRTVVESMTAAGDVHAEDGQTKLTGDRLLYREGKTQQVVLTGRDAENPAEVRWDDSLLRCGHITYTEGLRDDESGATLTRAVGTEGGYVKVVDTTGAATGAKPDARGGGTQIWFGDQVTYEERTPGRQSHAVFTGRVRSEQGSLRVVSDLMTVWFERAASTPDANKVGALSVKVVENKGNVHVTELVGPEELRKEARCETLAWDRGKNEVTLLARPQDPEGHEVVRLVQGGNTLETPMVRALVTDRGLERSFTEGGGKLVCFTRTTSGRPEAEPRRMTVTWQGGGTIEAEKAHEPGQPEGLLATFKGETVSRMDRDELAGDTLKVYMRSRGKDPTEPVPAGGSAGLDVHQVVAIGNVRARLYDEGKADYRYARGGRLSWDRHDGRMVLGGPEAIAWSRTGEWRGTEVLIRRRNDGTLFIHSVGTELIFFANEPRYAGASSADAAELDEWEPLD